MNLSLAILNQPQASTTAPAPGSIPSKLTVASEQFESLLIGEMLKSAREGSEDGWLGSGSDSGSETASGMAETQFAQAIASHGGFGLAKAIQHSMEKQSSANRQLPPVLTSPAY
jgi:Rod binding domain-containing protein